MIHQQRGSTASATTPTSLQHNVVLHSNDNEPLLPATNRSDLNLPLDQDSRNQLNRKANSLMTVYEHPSTYETNIGESSSSKSETWRARSPSSICDLTYQRTTNVLIPEKSIDQQETVRTREKKTLIYFFSFSTRYDSECNFANSPVFFCFFLLFVLHSRKKNFLCTLVTCRIRDPVLFCYVVVSFFYLYIKKTNKPILLSDDNHCFVSNI